MKKLLLATMIMIGVSGIASAQTPEAVKAKKAAAKANTNQPALITANEAKPSANKVTVTDAELAKRAKATQVVEVKKAVHPHPGKAKQNQ